MDIAKARRENTLTIQFLAQPLINDSVWPDQRGIRTLLAKAKNHHGRSIFLSDAKIDYSFLFHLEDFMPPLKKDKSEIDLLLIQGNIMYLVEVKTFTDANNSGVKREIVRNYLTLKKIIEHKEHFQEITEIISILLYSNSYQENMRGKNSDFDYFNEHFLVKQGTKQKAKMLPADWRKGNYSLNTPLTKDITIDDSLISEINKKLNFLTWDDVLQTYEELKEDGRISHVIELLKEKEDAFADNKIKYLLV